MDKQQIQDAFVKFTDAREALKEIIMNENGSCQKGDVKWHALRAQDHLVELVMKLSERVISGGL